ncbi:DUF4145 domain-containing protein [Pseudoxanthomonas sp. z9]|uniref:DUF4145 domain-containing protein n=1 Tax=Pseudoxanthomonas sp. z9 TaxID=2584942 RepID=UPI001141CB61|nr:DUF4145 domain-containing protein [Pseudoxanthomonas sp. z9]
MALQIKVATAGGSETFVLINTDASHCPLCGRDVHPLRVYALQISSNHLQIAYRCPSSQCMGLFVSYYASVRSTTYEFQGSAPKRATRPDFPGAISETSPTFVEIMGQVAEAEARSLDQLVGIGLRKALEFLVKDYASLLQPEKTTGIRSSTLAQCIENYVTDTNIKQCAKLATWLGNDETHYERKWTTKDVTDLRILVRLCVNWIETSLLTKKYQEDMDGGK